VPGIGADRQEGADMHVTSFTGRLAIAAGALGVTALTSGLAGAGTAMAQVVTPGAAVQVATSARVAGAAVVLPPIPTKITLGLWPGRAGTRAAAKYFGYPYPHPPACTNGGACKADKWAFYRGQCTSWVAYRLNQAGGVAFTNYYLSKSRWGDAVRWGPKAKKLGITVNTTPTVGAIAWYSATRAAPDGHVAYVERVNSAKSFVMSEMNYDGKNGFYVHTITRTTGDWPTEFIHFARSAR
jgi:surface antigen